MNLDYFFSADRPAAALINGVILILMGYAVARLAWNAIVDLRGERARIQQLGSLEDLDADRCRDLIAGFPARSPLRKRIELLIKIRARHQPVDLVPLSAIATEQFRQQVGTARFIGPSLVLLGLLGTVLGLGTAVTELAALLGGGMSTDALRTGILETLGGMKTAFSTTLVGIAGSIVVGIALRLHARPASRTLQELESLSIGTLVPIYDTSEASILDLSVTRLQALTDSLEERLGSIADKLENRGNALELSIRKGFDETIEQFVLKSSELLAGLRTVRDQVLDIVGEPEPGTSTLAYHVGQFGQVADRLRQSTESARQLLPEMQAAIGGILRQHHDEIVRDFTLRSETTQTILAQQVEATRGLRGAVESFSEQANTMTKDLTGLAASAERFAAIWEEVSTALRSAEDELVSRLSTMERELRVYLKQLHDDQTEAQLPVLKALRGFEESLINALRLLEDEPQRYSRQAEELLAELRQLLGRNLGVISTLAEEYQGSNHHVADALRSLQLEIRTAASARSLSAAERRIIPAPVRDGSDPTLDHTIDEHSTKKARTADELPAAPRAQDPDSITRLQEFYGTEDG